MILLVLTGCVVSGLIIARPIIIVLRGVRK